MTEGMSNQSKNGGAFFTTAMTCNAKLMNFAFDNISANLDYAGKLTKARSPSDIIDITSHHLRDRFEIISEQIEEMTELLRQAEPAAFRGAEDEKATFFE